MQSASETQGYMPQKKEEAEKEEEEEQEEEEEEEEGGVEMQRERAMPRLVS